jgi:hypothetical protein
VSEICIKYCNFYQNKIFFKAGKDDFGSDPFAMLHAPPKGSNPSPICTESPALPPKKKPPRPAPPRPNPPKSNDGFGSSFANFDDFDLKVSEKLKLCLIVIIITIIIAIIIIIIRYYSLSLVERSYLCCGGSFRSHYHDFLIFFLLKEICIMTSNF